MKTFAPKFIFVVFALLCTALLFQNCSDSFNADAYSDAASNGGNGGANPNVSVKVAGGSGFTCALKSGIVSCWGLNSSGQLGTNDTTNRPTPTPIVLPSIQPPVRFKQISAGNNHACAVTTDDIGQVYCWGNNNVGQIGNGAVNTNILAPIQVSGLVNIDIEEVTAGHFYSCARSNAGQVYCWGSNHVGQLGRSAQPIGPGNYSLVPVLVDSLSGIVDIDASYATEIFTPAAGRTCAVNSSGGVACWGLSYSTVGASVVTASPATIPGISTAKKIETSDRFSCALLGNNSVTCFGHNFYGQLGTGAASGLNVYTTSPTTPVQNLSNVYDISLGEYHACALLLNGSLRCWGRNRLGINTNSGALGVDPTTTELTAVVTQPSWSKSTNVIHFSSGNAHNCFVQSNGHLKCFGFNGSGQLSPTAGAFSFTPIRVILD